MQVIDIILNATVFASVGLFAIAFVTDICKAWNTTKPQIAEMPIVTEELPEKQESAPIDTELTEDIWSTPVKIKTDSVQLPQIKQIWCLPPAKLPSLTIVAKMKKPELVAELQSWGYDTKGNADVLRKRLRQLIKAQAA